MPDATAPVADFDALGDAYFRRHIKRDRWTSRCRSDLRQSSHFALRGPVDDQGVNTHVSQINTKSDGGAPLLSDAGARLRLNV